MNYLKENQPLQLDGKKLQDIHVLDQSDRVKLTIGMTINLYANGHRDVAGLAYKRAVEDIQHRLATFFVARNDNGKLRKLTPKAILKEHAEFDTIDRSENPKKTRYPLVYISRYSNREGRELPPMFNIGYSDYDQDFSLSLTLPLEDDVRAQALKVLLMVQTWLPGFPLHCGTITPTMVHAHGYARQEIKMITERLPVLLDAHDNFAILDGLTNWGMITLLGPELTARLGGFDQLRRDIPHGFDVQESSGNSIIVAQADVFALTDTAKSRAETPYRELCAYFDPIRSSTYSMGEGDKKWTRFMLGHAYSKVVKLFHNIQA